MQSSVQMWLSCKGGLRKCATYFGFAIDRRLPYGVTLWLKFSNKITKIDVWHLAFL